MSKQILISRLIDSGIDPFTSKRKVEALYKAKTVDALLNGFGNMLNIPETEITLQKKLVRESLKKVSLGQVFSAKECLDYFFTTPEFIEG